MTVKTRLARWRMLILVLAAPLARAGDADSGRFYGMLRSRDLTPLGFLRLDMRPAHALSIEPGTFAARHRFDDTIVSFAVTENLQNLNNTPDVGFQLGIGWVPRLEK